jgi:cysteine desulfurase / selenocysteine lyase
MHNPESYRSYFPHIKENITYLNHAAISPLSTVVTERVNRYLRERSAGIIDNFEHIDKQFSVTKGRLAQLLRTSTDRIAFVDNTSGGLNILANGLTWKTGDRILLNRMEFPSNVYPFLNLKRHGVGVDFSDTSDNTIPVERLIAAVTPRTRIISISHVQYLNGYLSDLKELGAFCRERDIIFSVDVIQSAGAVPIDVEAMKIDFLASGSHKWLMAPEGIGFVYLTEALQQQIKQAYVGWTSISDYFERMREFKLDLDPTARRYENGMLNAAGIVGLGASLGLLLNIGIDTVRDHILDLTDHFIARLGERGLEYVSPADRNRRSGIVSFRPPNTDTLNRIMIDRKVHTAVRGGCVRVSPHFYNTIAEVDILLDCIDACVKESV